MAGLGPGHPRLPLLKRRKAVDARHRRQVYAVCAKQIAMAGHDELKKRRQGDGSLHSSRFKFQTAKTISNTPPRSRGAKRPSCASILRPKIEGVGNAGCAASTRSLAWEKNKPHEHSHHRSSRIHPAFPHAMVLTAYFALSPVIGLVCHRRQRIWHVCTRSGRHASADLTPASRRQDHTTSPSASASLVSTPLTAHGNPALPSRHAPNAAASTASRTLRP
jgi:hypothetical protein